MRSSGFPLLLRGPPGVGKWSAASEYARELSPAPRFFQTKVRMGDVREIVEIYSHRPLGGRAVVSVINLDETTDQGQTALLKTLEDPPSWAAQILCASREPLRTVVSRCRTVWFAALDREQVFESLREQGISAVVATSVAPLCRGAPGRGEYLAGVLEGKSRALSVVQALERRDRLTMLELAASLTDQEYDALHMWCLEVIARWPHIFSDAELDLAERLGMESVYEIVRMTSKRRSVEEISLAVWRRR